MKHLDYTHQQVVATQPSVHEKHYKPEAHLCMPCSDDGKPETRPPLLVTASVDRIALARRLALDADLTMAGSVIWTGRSALDIRMQLRQVWRTCSITSTRTPTQSKARRRSIRKQLIWKDAPCSYANFDCHSTCYLENIL